MDFFFRNLKYFFLNLKFSELLESGFFLQKLGFVQFPQHFFFSKIRNHILIKKLPPNGNAIPNEGNTYRKWGPITT